jgi:hypothetical protein
MRAVLRHSRPRHQPKGESRARTSRLPSASDKSLQVCRAHGGLLNRKAGFDSRAGDRSDREGRPNNISGFSGPMSRS